MRTITHTGVGPPAFDLDVPAAAVTVHCEDRDTAVVTLEAADPQDREALRLIERTTATSDAERFTVRVPGPKSAGHPIVVDGDPIIVSGTGGVIVTGSVADVTIVNGRLISAAGVVHRGGALRITARLPKGSAVIVAGQATNLTVHGEARAVGTNTVSGDVQVSAAATVRHRTTSGDLRIGITSDVTAHSVSGDVTVAQLSGRAAINTVAGDIAVHAVETSQVRAESVSGDIDITANPGVDVDADTHTVSGRSRNRRR